MPVSAIILAAGQSTRMKSRRPKPLHEVCGRPMLWHVLQACYQAGCSRVMVVVGHGKEQIMAEFAEDSRITWITQDQQHGTGHAALACRQLLQSFSGDVFILSADAPLVRGEVLRTLRDAHQEDRAAASMATAVLDNPTGWSRIIRDAKGDFVGIAAESDLTSEQRNIHEVFPGYYCVRVKDLCFALDQLSAINNTPSREYALAGIFDILRKEGRRIAAVQVVPAEDTLTVNTRQHLAEVDLVMQERIQRQIREEGVTITSGLNTYIEVGVSIGRDTTILPFCFIGRDATIGADCVIGPFAHIPRDSVIPEGTSLPGIPPQDTGVPI